MGHPDLTIHHMVRVYPGGRFDYRTPLSMGWPDPEQSFTNYGTAVGNNAPNEWSGWVYLDCHIPPHRAPLCQGIGGVPAAIIILRITWSSYASYVCSLLWCSWSYCVRVSSAHCLQNNDKIFIVFYQKRLHVFPLQKYLVKQAGQMFLHQWCFFFMIFCQTNLPDQPPHIAPENIKGKLW